MSISRRSLLQGMAAAPLAAAAGPALLAGTASAAPAALADHPFRLEQRVRPDWATSAPYPAVIKELAGQSGVRRASFREVLTDPDRLKTAYRARGWADAPDHLKQAFRWSDADVKDPDWFPQGITTTYDAFGKASREGKKAILVSWYAKGKHEWKGARVSFVDWTRPGKPTYRHVLLVEPFNRTGGPPDFVPLYKLHAGGIAWYSSPDGSHSRLYVADKLNGLRVFSLNDLFQVSPGGGSDSVGRQPNGAYHALGHKYVLPQTRAYDSVGLGLHFSQVSVDRTTGTPSLLVSEFRRKGGASPRGKDKAPRLVRWPLNPGTGAIAQQRDSGQFAMKGEWRIQGAVGIEGAYHFSLSNGDARGSLTSWKRGRPRPEPRELTKAPEDLSHHGSEKALWSLGEAVDNRYVYSVAVPPIPPRRA